jgi:hypothetical protein
MAWNAYAHGSAVHFVARVTTFRQTIGAAGIPLGEKLLGYPRALVTETPEVAGLGVVGLAALAGLTGLGGVGGREATEGLRARWRWAVGAMLAILVFLVWGDVHDGAPTHHPARALAAMWWVLVGMGVDAVVTLGGRLAPSRRAPVAGIAVLAGLAWCVWLPSRWADAPGRSDTERREGEIARGLELRARGVAHVEVTPCAFEHFALLAAWGEPWRATVLPRTGEPVTAACPLLVEQ